MIEYDEMCIKYFLEHHDELFGLRVIKDEEEALNFLEDCMAVVCKSIKEVRAYFEDVGVDIAELDDENLRKAAEVFELPDGRFLVVEG